MGDVMGDAVPEPVFAALMAEIEFARTPNAALGDVNVMHARIAADWGRFSQVYNINVCVCFRFNFFVGKQKRHLGDGLLFGSGKIYACVELPAKDVPRGKNREQVYKNIQSIRKFGEYG
jgi:hypothetical protein